MNKPIRLKYVRKHQNAAKVLFRLCNNPDIVSGTDSDRSLKLIGGSASVVNKNVAELISRCFVQKQGAKEESD